MTRRVDLRSDTVTQPTQAMRDAMAVGGRRRRRVQRGSDGPSVGGALRRHGRQGGRGLRALGRHGQSDRRTDPHQSRRPRHRRDGASTSSVSRWARRRATPRFNSRPWTTRTARLAMRDVLDIIDAEDDHQPHVAMVALENTHMPSGGTPLDVADIEALARAIGDRPVAPRRRSTLQRGRGDRHERRRSTPRRRPRS
jgi:hypothetical protein